MTSKANFLPFAAIFICALIIIFIGIKTFCTYSDEVYFADPAINYVENKTYITTVWDITNENEYHISTAQLYSLLLIVWFELVGWSLTTTRLLPIILALLSSIFLWLTCKRLSIVKTSGAGTLMVVVFLMDYGFSFSYNCGRPDALSALIAILLFYLYSFPNSFFKLFFAAFLSILIPFTQYVLAIYFVALLPVLILIFKKKVSHYAILILASIIGGFVLQLLIYKNLGIWDVWMATIRSEGSENIVQRIINKLTTNPLTNHSNSIPKDFSAAILFIGIFILYLKNLATKNALNNNVLGYGLIIATATSLAMYFLGKFPTYYGWMPALPLSVVIANYFESELDRPRGQSRLAFSIAVFAIILGLPMQAALAAYDWKDRQTAGFQSWLDDKIDENDIVYCDFPFYFFVKNKVKAVYSGKYYNLMTDEDKSKITLAIIGKKISNWHDKNYFLRFGITAMHWKPSKSGFLGNDSRFGILSAPNYECTVYRLK